MSPFFSWKHWGCVTPRNLEDVSKELEGDHANLDGFEDLSEDDQERVAQALAAGKIAEEDGTAFTEEEQRIYNEYLADEERLKEMRQEAKAAGNKFDLKTQRKALEDRRIAARKAVVEQAKADAKAAKVAEREAKKVEKASEKTKNQDAKASKKRKQVKDEDDDDEVNLLEQNYNLHAESC